MFFFWGLIIDFGTPKQAILAHPQILIIFGIWNTEISHRKKLLTKIVLKKSFLIAVLSEEILIFNANFNSFRWIKTGYIWTVSWWPQFNVLEILCYRIYVIRNVAIMKVKSELWREIIIRNLNSEPSLIKNFWSPNNVM